MAVYTDLFIGEHVGCLHLYTNSTFTVIFQGIFDSMFYGFGQGSGGAVTGLLFNAIGPRDTLRCYCVAAALVFVFFGMYVSKSKNIAKYERVESSESDSENKSEHEDEE